MSGKDCLKCRDTGYRDFHARLVPTVEKEKIIGIRTPILRKFAKEFGKTERSEMFLKVLPHQYYEENNLHGLLIEQIRDYDKCLKELERFLPYIDNWATCDLLTLHMMKNTVIYLSGRFIAGWNRISPILSGSGSVC